MSSSWFFGGTYIYNTEYTASIYTISNNNILKFMEKFCFANELEPVFGNPSAWRNLNF